MSGMSRHLSLTYCLLAAAPTFVLAKDNRPCAKDPFADPRHDPCNPLDYIPSNTLTAVTFGQDVHLFWPFHSVS